jgi:5'-3' exonuclease
MGIEGFGAWVENTYGRRKNDIITKGLPTNISCLFLDMNGIFHAATQMVFGYGKGDPKDPKNFKSKAEREKQEELLKEYAKLSKEELENEIFKLIVLNIFTIIDEVQPEDYAVLAIDGVAPMAKITQQRKRRYVKALESLKISEDEIENDQDLNFATNSKKFDSNCITPGTDFMFKLDYFIQKSINENIKANNFNVKNIVYSSHLVPGEGEHKIFDILRNKYIEVEMGKNVLVYGADADLFMLTLLSKQPGLYLWREKRREAFNIDILRKEIASDMLTGMEAPFSRNIIIQDFVILMFLIGNDFLPHMPSLNELSVVANRVFITYSILELPLTDEEGQILWSNFAKFIRNFSKYETKLLEQIAAKDYDNPYVTLDKASTKVKDPETNKMTTTVDLMKFRELWYEKALLPKNKEVLGFMSVKPEMIEDMCLEYIKGMQWCLRYYLYGHKSVSSKYIYIYFYTPLLYDLAEVLERVEISKLPTISDVRYSLDDPYITPIHQLICVQPPTSWNLIPEPYRSLMPLRFQDICPRKFILDKEGLNVNFGRKEHTAVAILPIADPFRIVRDIEDYPIPEKYGSAINKFVSVIYNPKVPRVKGVKAEFRDLIETQAPVVVKMDAGETIAKVEPKSPAQIKRIVKSRVAHIVKDREEVKKLKADNNFAWVNYDLM